VAVKHARQDLGKIIFEGRFLFFPPEAGAASRLSPTKEKVSETRRSGTRGIWKEQSQNAISTIKADS
jgi:hypothetical protein